MRLIPSIRNGTLGMAAGFILGTSLPATLSAATIDRTNPTVGTTTAAVSAQTVGRAIEALMPAVPKQSHPRALETAVNAYFAYKAAHPEAVKKPYLYFVDFGLSQTEARGYVFDMNSLTVVDGPFPVAHGSGSGSGVPTRFSNAPRSRATSLGLYVTANTYAFSGHNNGRPYASVGLRLEGQSKGFNDSALARGVVAHGAPYVTASKAGKSQGCPAMEPSRAARLLPTIANGSVVFLFAPDGEWMARDRWASAALG